MKSPYTEEQLDQILSDIPRVRPRRMFRAGLHARLFLHTFATDLRATVLPQAISYATASASVLVVLFASVFAYDNPNVNAGSLLYPLKQAGESIEVSFLASTPEEKAEAHLVIAERRREEFRSLRDQVGQGYVEETVLQKTLDNYVNSTEKALAAAKESASPRLQKKVALVAAQEATELKNITQHIATDVTDTPPSDIGLSGSGTEVMSTENTQMVSDAVEALEQLASQTPGAGDTTSVSSDAVPVIRGQ